MRIAFVNREFPPSKRMGGIATYAWETARYLSSHGHEIFVLAASDNISSESVAVDNGVRIIRLAGGDFFIGDRGSLFNTLRSHLRRLRFFRAYREAVAKKLQELVMEYDIDIVEFAEYGNEAAIWACQKRSIPWVVRLHGPTLLDHGKAVSIHKSPLLWWFGHREMATAKKATAITAPSKALANKVASFLGLVNSDKNIVMIPNAIDIKNWMPSDTCKSRERKHSFRIFSAGSIVSGKGYGDLVESVKILKKRGFDITLDLAGKFGRLGKKLYRMQQRDKNAGWLTLLGDLPREQLADNYSNADIVVFPSWWESFGLVCIEAMAVGALVLGSSEGGMAEIITENEDGFLVKPKAPEALADKIESILKLPNADKERIKAKAIQKIAASYSLQSVMGKQLSFYQTVIDQYRKARS